MKKQETDLATLLDVIQRKKHEKTTTYLDIWSKSITHIPSEIGELKNLERLHLKNNQNITSLPSEIGRLKSLKKIIVDKNNNLTRVPPEIGNLKKLEFLDFSNNQITSIPSEIGQLENLKYLNLNNNNIAQIPPEIGKLKKLEFLDFSKNNITYFPSELCQLKNLKYLDIEQNLIVSIPTAIRNLENLEVIKIFNLKKHLEIYPVAHEIIHLSISNQANYNSFDPEISYFLQSNKSAYDYITNHSRVATKILLHSLCQINKELFFLSRNKEHFFVRYQEQKKISSDGKTKTYIQAGISTDLNKSFFIPKQSLKGGKVEVFYNWEKLEKKDIKDINERYLEQKTIESQKKIQDTEDNIQEIQEKSSKKIDETFPQKHVLNIIKNQTVTFIPKENKHTQSIKSIEENKPFDNETININPKRSTLITPRPNQSQFRESILYAYERKCAITNCDLEEVLEAAHIKPYSVIGKSGDRVDNGILLRSDIHKLFDLYLISIHPTTKKVVVSPQILNSSYRELEGIKLRVPQCQHSKPNRKVLEEHYHKFLEKNK